MARLPLISQLARTTLSYLFMAQAILAFVLATQVIFEWSTAGLKWTTAAACAGTIFLAAGLRYLSGRCQAPDREIRGATHRTQGIRSFKLARIAVSLVVVMPFALVAYKYAQVERVVTTGPGQLHHMTLTDGTAVHVDAHSKVEVAYTADERIVRLYEGSAVFDVAKDGKRPFIARTHLVDVIAVGTKFGVSIDTGVTTTVSEGEVRITARGQIEHESVMLKAGEELRVFDSALTSPHVATVNAEQKLQWANGLLVLGGMTVAEGAAELNRRNRIQIVIDSPTLAARVVEFASVNVDAPERYARIVAAEPGVTMIIDKENGVIRLSE